jgi:hypothetical protein
MTATKSTDIQRFINLLLLLTGAKDAKSQENVASILHFCLLFYQKEHGTLHPPEFGKGLEGWHSDKINTLIINIIQNTLCPTPSLNHGAGT